VAKDPTRSTQHSIGVCDSIFLSARVGPFLTWMKFDLGSKGRRPHSTYNRGFVNAALLDMQPFQLGI
jgi:hypothetical protein